MRPGPYGASAVRAVLTCGPSHRLEPAVGARSWHGKSTRFAGSPHGLISESSPRPRSSSTPHFQHQRRFGGATCLTSSWRRGGPGVSRRLSMILPGRCLSRMADSAYAVDCVIGLLGLRTTILSDTCSPTAPCRLTWRRYGTISSGAATSTREWSCSSARSARPVSPCHTPARQESVRPA